MCMQGEQLLSDVGACPRCPRTKWHARAACLGPRPVDPRHRKAGWKEGASAWFCNAATAGGLT
jgi:hypothetical protein